MSIGQTARRRVPFARPLDMTRVDEAFHERFWAKVDQRATDECWPWIAYRKPSGYGQFTVRKGVFMTASRVALALTIGRPLVQGEVACHQCDNPPCCNPAHLFPGTQSVNALDSVSKGRASRICGSACPSSKLTEADVAVIRSVPHRYGLNAQLAREYGVSATTIRKARQGKLWGHLAAPTNTARTCTKGHALSGANLLPIQDPSRRTFCARCAEDFRVSRLVGTA